MKKKNDIPEELISTPFESLEEFERRIGAEQRQYRKAIFSLVGIYIGVFGVTVAGVIAIVITILKYLG